MSINFFCFLSFFLMCHSSTANNISMPTCPLSFSCPALVPFRYPFYNDTDTRCGLIKVSCTSTGGEIEVGGWKYEILRNLYLNDNSFSLLGWSSTFDQLVKNKSCEALKYNNLISPSPLLYSISISPNITLFKCTKSSRTAAYFRPHNYSSFNACKDHNFYYNFYNGTVPSDLPNTCQVVLLPGKLPDSPGLDETNIFSLLDPSTFFNFHLSPSCDECQKNSRRCVIVNEHGFECLDIKKEKTVRVPTWVKIVGNTPLPYYACIINY